MRTGFRKEQINYNGFSFRVEMRFWTNHHCKICEQLNMENPVVNRLFHTYSGKEFRKHLKEHKKSKDV